MSGTLADWSEEPLYSEKMNDAFSIVDRYRTAFGTGLQCAGEAVICSVSRVRTIEKSTAAVGISEPS